MKLAILMDPIEHINIQHDSSFALLLATQARGWSIYYFEDRDLFWQQENAFANACLLTVKNDQYAWFEKGEQQVIALADFDVILMRKDPPFTIDYIYLTYFLDHAKQAGTLVVNDPQALRDCNEKFIISHFSELIAPTIIGCNMQLLHGFFQQHQDVIIKPLDGMGGVGIYRITQWDATAQQLLQEATAQGRRMIMMQRYINEIAAGDKRILMVDGEPIPFVVARFATGNSVRANLAAGGTFEIQELSASDRLLCSKLKNFLQQRGILLAGLDVIGNYLTEINITSPTCLQEIMHHAGYNVAEQLLDKLAQKLA